MEKILIIGGNAAGLTAASRAKRIDPRLDVTVLEKGPHISYSTCGIPYFLAKLVRPEDLISFDPESFEKERGIKVHTHSRVDEIVPSRKRVFCTRTDTGERAEFSFDRLLIATGVRPQPPQIPGTNLENVFTLTNLEDALRINDALANAQRVAIVGAGYVGLEMAECLHLLGKAVHIYEKQAHVLPGMDPDMAQIIEYELQRFGVRLSVGAKVLALTGGTANKLTGVRQQVDWESIRQTWYSWTQALYRMWNLLIRLGFKSVWLEAFPSTATWKPTCPGSLRREIALKHFARSAAVPS